MIPNRANLPSKAIRRMFTTTSCWLFDTRALKTTRCDRRDS